MAAQHLHRLYQTHYPIFGQKKNRFRENGSLQAKETHSVFSGARTEVLRRHASQLCQEAADMLHIPRIIAPAANRFRCQVRAVCFDQEPVLGHLPGCFLKL